MRVSAWKRQACCNLTTLFFDAGNFPYLPKSYIRHKLETFPTLRSVLFAVQCMPDKLL